MTDVVLPGIGLRAFWAYGENGWNTDMDSNLFTLSALTHLSVLSQTTALPGSPGDGDIYIVPHGAGANPDSVAVFTGTAWSYLTPTVGTIGYVRDASSYLHWDGTNWTPLPAGSVALSSLTDTAISAPAVGQVPTWNGAKWQNETPSGGSATFAGLTDVSLTSPANGDVPIYNTSAGKWENGPMTGTGGSATFAALTDVAVSSPAVGQVPTWNGAKWQNETPSGGGGSGANPPNPTGTFNYTSGGSGVTQTYAYDPAVGLSLRRTDAGGGGLSYSFMGQPIPTTGTWTIDAKISPFEVGTPYFNAGLMLLNSANGSAGVIYAFNNTSSVQSYHDYTSYGADITGPAGICNQTYVRTRVHFDGATTFSFSISYDDGLSYTQIGTLSSLSDVAPTHVGVAMSCYASIAAGCGALVTQWLVGP
jgi:hypothetical protein